MRHLISVIVPMYNVEKYIGKCIESLINQTYSNIEIILVNDGSPDSSGLIADAYACKDSRITVIHNSNMGVSSARNCGLDIANGDYVCFIDGDDWILSDFIHYMHALAVDTGAEMVMSKGVVNSKIISEDVNEIWNSDQATAAILYPEIPLGVWNKMFCRKMIEKNSLRFLSGLFMGEGLNFIVSASQFSNKIAITNRKMYFYRKDNESSATTALNISKMKNALIAIENLNNNLTDPSKEVRAAIDYHYWMTCFNWAVSMKKSGIISGNEDFYRECLSDIKSRSLQVFFSSQVSMFRRIRIALVWVFPNLSIYLSSRLKRW